MSLKPVAVKVIGAISVAHRTVEGFSKFSSIGVGRYIQSSLYGVSYRETVSILESSTIICSCDSCDGVQ